MRSVRRIVWSGFVLWSLVAGGAPAVAGARLPVETLTCGTTLEYSVQLAADIDCTGVATGFGLYLFGRRAPIVLDLGGHDLILSSQQLRAIYVDSFGGTTIRNGRILLAGRAYSSGIETIDGGGVKNLTISNVTIVGTGVEYGIYLVRVTKAALSDLAIDGVYDGVSSTGSSVTIARSSVSNFRRYGFYSSYDFIWRGSDLTSAAETGRTSFQVGFYGEASDLFDLRSSSATGARGNAYSAGVEVDMPSAFFSGFGYTMFQATLVGNRTLDNEHGVIFYGTPSTYGAVGTTTLSDNIASGNVRDGFSFNIRAFNPLSITNNLSSGNGDDGFEVVNNGGSCGGSCSFLLSSNTARLNGDRGFVSGYLDIPTSNNGVYRNAGLKTLAGQCVNVSCVLLRK